ncbi:hypothetical protein [Methyloversatilis sp. XJ19-49]|uniref:hypothetical protein n=1 Tax=Methyloversatilis sp. XJ19-49 TaxID=2963429 RepID=UPI00211BFCD1|nr:hypothetical protein [Methyloversatilis sp. XJ19-49]MCQ9377664.1 hypothetical protein [Methyloversatilis sp. XJ19-49]
MRSNLPFEAAPRARAKLDSGTLYAIDGGDSFIYFGQVAANRQLGFFRYRSHEASANEALAAPLMSRFGVLLPSIGIALREGKWLHLGHHELRPELSEVPVVVQWPVGTLDVTLWKGSTVIGSTKVHDPAIQDLEVIAAYDAVHHVPNRLQADFTQSDSAWSAGGTIRRERLKKQDLATRFPEQPWHKLPSGWVAVR